MFKDQISLTPRYLNKYAESAKPHLARHTPVRPLRNQKEDELKTGGWGLTFALDYARNEETGRPAGTASWEGIANLFWFADRETGVGGMIASQILPYGGKFVLFSCHSLSFLCSWRTDHTGTDNQVLDTNDAVEKLLYSGLKRDENSYK